MPTNARMIAMWTMLAIIGACGLLGVVGVMTPSRFIDERVLMVGFVVGMHALGAMVLIAVGRDQTRLMIASIALLALAMITFSLSIVFDNVMHWQTQQNLARAGVTGIDLAIVLGHRMLVAPMLTAYRGNTLVRLVKRTALISAPITGVLLLIPLYLEDVIDSEQLFLRIFGVGLIIAATSTLALGAMALLMRKPGEDEPGMLTKGVRIAFACPRCASPIEAHSGRESRCAGCRLRVRVTLDEPRCECGYLLYELESDTCPECGRDIPDEDRWGAVPGGDGRSERGNGQ